MRIAAAAGLAGLLAGCASQAMTPPLPTPADLAARDFSTIGLSPSDVALVGFERVRYGCTQWFTAQVQSNQGASFLMQLLSLGAGGAAMAGVPGAAAGSALASAAVGSYQSAFGAGSQ